MEDLSSFYKAHFNWSCAEQKIFGTHDTSPHVRINGLVVEVSSPIQSVMKGTWNLLNPSLIKLRVFYSNIFRQRSAWGSKNIYLIIQTELKIWNEEFLSGFQQFSTFNSFIFRVSELMENTYTSDANSFISKLRLN